jgi:peptide/nickel transport system permease protein
MRAGGFLPAIWGNLVQLLTTFFLTSLLVFVLVHITGNPAALMLPEYATDEDREVLTRALGLDQPLHVQYLTYLGNLVVGDFGTSFRYKEAALPVVLERLPATLELAGAALVLALLIAVPLGVVAALKRNSLVDLAVTSLATLNKAMPNFWVAILLIMLFSVHLRLLPVSGRASGASLILPALTLAMGIAAEMARLVRSSMLEILGQDYVRFARAKGAGAGRVVFRHALRNALVPLVSIIGLQVTHLFSGALITETVFAWPGMGLLIIQAVNMHDMAIVQASVFVVAALVIATSTIVDLGYGWLDPRIRTR